MANVIGNVAVNTRASPSNNIALGDNIVGASSTKGNGLRNSAVADVANAESMLVNAHEFSGNWAWNRFGSASTGSVIDRAGVAGSRGHGGSAGSCGQCGDRSIRRRS